MITTVVFDIGDTLVRAAAPGTPVEALVAEPLPGAVRTLRALRANGIRVGAVTDTSVMSEADVRAALTGSELDELLEVIVTSADVGADKPDPRGLLAALDALGARVDEALFVGDADVDEAAAGVAGVAFARVDRPPSMAELADVDRATAPARAASTGGAVSAMAAASGAPDRFRPAPRDGTPTEAPASRDAHGPAVARERAASDAEPVGRAGHARTTDPAEAATGAAVVRAGQRAGDARPAAAAGAGLAPRTVDAAVRAGIAQLHGHLAAALALVGLVDHQAERAAEQRHLRLTKPPGSLGRLEALGVQLSAISGEVPPPVPCPAAVAVFAGDHGVVASGVTPWPQDVTAQMVATIVAGGAAINVLARQAGATVTVVDVGVATDLDALGLDDAPDLLRARIRAGTADLSAGAAMTVDEARRALDVGAAVASQLVTAGARALVTGDMGIGNTTPSAAIVAALTGAAPAAVTGRGTGVDDATLRHKVGVIEQALQRVSDGAGALDVLAEVGGLEIAALAGFIVGGASERVPIVVDGLIAGAALLVAHALHPGVLPYVVAGHRSTEPGATAVLDRLGLAPVLDLDLRLGEGSGACLALGPLEAAARILGEMATFDEARIGGSH